MKLAIMQPYFLSYIGYFQLINVVDTFVIYDDVNYIKQGWINRNRILLNNQPFYFTLNLKGASSFKKINEIESSFNSNKLLKTIYQAYNKSPFFDDVYALIENIFKFDNNSLSSFVTNSIIEVSKYLGINTKFEISSKIKVGEDLKGSERVIEICKYFQTNIYINAIGGFELYSKNTFNNTKIELQFLKTNNIDYKQYNYDFIPNLSIIDVMMFNPIDKINELLENYTLK